MIPNCIQKVLAERPLNNVGKIHNGIKAVIEGDNQFSDEINKNTRHGQEIKSMKQEPMNREYAHNGQSQSKVLADPPCNYSTPNSTLNINVP